MNNSVAKTLKSLFAILLMIGVLFVFVAPSLSLQPTALRAAKAALALALFLAAAAVNLSGRLPFNFFPVRDVTEPSKPSEDMLALVCSRLC